MATLGVNDLKQYALPTYWDASVLSQIRLASGETYEQWLAEVAAALAEVNGMLLTDPLISGLISTTDEAALEYRVGVSNGFETHTEYGLPDQKRAKTTGHMLGLSEYDRGMGWTWDFLRKARRVQLDADIASAIKDVRDEWAKQILTRLFKSTYTSVGTGRSMPVADGGTADSTYVPVNHPDRASAFAYTHTHLGRLSGITQGNLETGLLHLWEHGIDGPYELLIAQADKGSWTTATNVTGYVPRALPEVRYGITQDLAAVSDDYIGAVETIHGACRMRASARIPTKYWALYKSYGPQDQRNVMRVRYDPDFGIGAVLLAGDHIRQYPLENAIMYMSFGPNIGEDRCAAYLCYNHTSGAYTDPTIL